MRSKEAADISVLDNMLELLQPLSIYHITDDSYIMSELKSYCAAFEPCAAQLETNITDSFIQTCSTDGLRIFEGACGCDLSGLDESERRQRIIYMLSVFPSSFNEDGIMTALNSVGYDGEITVDIQNELIVLSDIGAVDAPEDYKDVVSMAERILPAHFDYSIDAPSYTWAELDAFDRTFFHIDSLNFRWNVFLDDDN